MRVEKIGLARLYLGDCLQILPTLGHVESIVTDPPYGTNNKSSWNGLHGDCTVMNDLDLTARNSALAVAKFDRALVFGSWRKEKPAGTRQTLIWEKGGHCGMGDLKIPWKPNFEEIYVLGSGFEGSRSSGVLHFIADRECNGVVRERYHPTEKPVPLMRELIRKTPGTILDPFMGSGTTGVACAELGRAFIGIEIDPKYFETACRRLDEAQKQISLFEIEPTATKQDSLFDDESA